MAGNSEVNRRTFITRVGLAAASASLIAPLRDAGAQVVVPNSSGTDIPKLQAPANACDCHHHIYDAVRFPPPADSSNPMVSRGRVEEYQLLRKRLHTTRSVIVTPAPYVTDNRVTLDAIARLGGTARGVAVVRPEVTDAELKALDRGGIRGIRFSLSLSAAVRNPVTTIDMVEPLSKRIADLGWHVQLNVNGQQVVEWADLLRRVPCPIVFDHMAHPPLPEGVAHPSYRIVRGLLDRGRTWVKLSGAYSNSRVGPPYPEATSIAQAFVKAAPERMVWGSDWPHPSEASDHKPNDAVLFDLLSAWAPSETTRHRILVENPATLYGFGQSA